MAEYSIIKENEKKDIISRDVRCNILRNQILSILGSFDGLTITDVAKKLGIHYTTASKYLAVLEAEKKIYHRMIGTAKVFKVVKEE